MSRAALWSLASVACVSAVSLIGVAALGSEEARVRRLAARFVSFAAGALLGDAFLHLIPQALSAGRPLAAGLLVVSGMLLFFVLERALRRSRGAGLLHRCLHEAPRPQLAAMNLLGDAVHNFVDGLVIAASYLAGPALGAATTLAVLVHEIPQELADFAILVHAGLSPRRAVRLNLGSAAAALFGAVVALWAGSLAKEAVVGALVPLTAGNFIYLAAAGLMPELQHETAPRAWRSQLALMAAGVAVMAALAWTQEPPPPPPAGVTKS